MHKRESSVPVIELEGEMANKQRKKCVIDITAPPLKLQKNRSQKLEQTNKSKRVLKALSRSKVEKFPQNHEEKSSLLYESKTTPETFDDIPVPDEENPYIFSIKRCDSDESQRRGKQKRNSKDKKMIKYEPHPQDKMHERIQSVEVDFRPMTVEESIGFNRDRFQCHGNSKNLNEDPFKKFLPQRKYYKIYPSIFINKDHKRGLFAMEVNRPDSNLNVQNEHRIHDAALNKVLERLSEQEVNDEKNPILKPKPTTKYCFVCRGHFDEYMEHIETRWHQHNDVNAKIWQSIKEICKKVQGLAVEEKIKNLKWTKLEQKMAKKEQNKAINSKIDTSNQKKINYKSEEKSKDKKNKKSKEKLKPKEQPELKQFNKDQKIFKKPEKNEDKKPENMMVLETQTQKVQQLRIQVEKKTQEKIKNSDDKEDRKIEKKQISRQATIFRHSKIKNVSQKQMAANNQGQKLKKLMQIQKLPEKIEKDHQANHKIVKSYTNLTVVPQTQILISILPSQYPKLVPQGHTYRKPSKPACVSLCLTANEDQKPKKRGPNKKQSKSKKNVELAKDSSVYKQQKIQDWFKVKTDEKEKQIVKQKKEKKEKKKQENQGQGENCERTSHKFSQIEEEKPSNSEETKRKFMGLAKTRSRQKQNMLNPERCQLSPIITE